MGVTDDAAYEQAREDLQALYRPLFYTSFMLADFLADNAFFGAETVVISSASSKTAYGTAFELRRGTPHPRLVGLTSRENVAFTTSLGWYDQVLGYDEVTALAATPTAYVDVSGSAALRTAVHEHLAGDLVHDAVVGAARHTEQGSTGRLPGARPAFFFAPDQIRKRSQDWGTPGLDDRFGAAWRAFAPAVEPHVDVQVGAGPGDLQATWQQVLAGTAPPRAGLVVQL